MFGGFIGHLWVALGRPRIEQVFVEELASRVPLPFGHEIAVAARGLQTAGIFICCTDGSTTRDSACLRDLLVNEGKSQLDNLLQGTLQNWNELPIRMHDGSGTAAPGLR
ncbi:hypothetical protein AB0F71_25425 [Kitasatospora sp. NPDC028055]|uniref:hypothetical protein n=1 Tax=Kitasatospora sp. NPDC028055 TaxID=3155653 RepID=UPI00340BA081